MVYVVFIYDKRHVAHARAADFRGVRIPRKVKFKGSGVSLFSRSIYDKQGKLVAIKLQFAKKVKS